MSDEQSQMTLFTKSYDYIAWLMPLTNNFPRSHRLGVTQRLRDSILDFQERLFDANHVRGKARLEWIEKADAALDKHRNYLRLVFHWRWINVGQYEHGARQLAEIGRLLGGWKKQTIRQMSKEQAR